MDNELGAEEKRMVEAFLLLHPHLQEEMDILLSTKLSPEEFSFPGKESLKGEAMKLNAVDDSLLLYLDNELSASERKAVEEKISANKDLRLQYEILEKTKLDATEIIPHPAKAELSRRETKVVPFTAWMRVAVAVVLVLFASLFFVLNQKNNSAVTTVGEVASTQPKTEKANPSPANDSPTIKTDLNPAPQQPFTADVNTKVRSKTPDEKKEKAKLFQPQKQTTQVEEMASNMTSAEKKSAEKLILPSVEPIKTNVPKLAEQPIVSINNSAANLPVTSHRIDTLNQEEAPLITAGVNEDFKPKRSSAKGFLRKVSRFIERRTGIGTVNADNELLVGAVALKLN